jgi:hypothetical protein
MRNNHSACSECIFANLLLTFCKTESHFSAAKNGQLNCAVLNEIQWPVVLFPTIGLLNNIYFRNSAEEK